MRIEDFKKLVVSHTFVEIMKDGMVLKITDESSLFIIHNYLDQISKTNFSDDGGQLTYKVRFIEDYSEIEDSLLNPENVVYVVRDNNACKRSSVIVICDNDRQDITCTIPKLESWQFVDLMCALLPGLEFNEVDGLFSLYSGNYDQFYEDMKKVSCFEESTQKLIAQELIANGAFDNRTTKTIFDLVTALVRNDVASTRSCYKLLYYIDKEPTMLLLTLLVKNFRQALIAQTCRTATPEQLGCTDKQAEIIKRYNCGYYSNSRLEEIYFMLTGIEDKFKNGGLDYDNVIDYIIINILR